MEELIDFVKRMRESQKEYFRYRNSAALEKSKFWERKVDSWIRNYEDPQIKMFKDESND